MTVLSVLLNITVFSAVIYGAIMLFRLIFKKHVSPSLMYLVWFLLIARLIIPVTLDSGFSLITIPDAQAQYVVNTPVDETGGSALPEEGGLLPASQQETAAQNTAMELSAFTLDLPTVLVATWVLGMVLMLILTLAASIKLKARLLKDSVPIPDEWLDIVESIKSDLRVRGSVRIVMTKDFVSPALSASIYPVIVMPEQMVAQSPEKIEFALRHEITHLKRKDHLLCLLLIVLRIVYWFNPVLWLASKQIRMDMETACDSGAVSSMSKEDTQRYAATVLDMYASENVRFVLGMSLCGTKKTAERRVRGIFMRRRSSHMARIAAAVLVAVMLMVCFTTACQPVPGTPTDSGGTPSQTATAENPSPSGTEPESSATQTATATVSATVSPSESATASPTPTATPAPEPVATLPRGITAEAKFTADTNGDGVNETIVVGSKGTEAISVYVLYVGGYHKIDVGEAFQTFQSAYLTQTAAGKLCLLVSIDEASEDYVTFPISFNGTTPVLHDKATGYASKVSGTQVTLNGHMDVIGTWDYTRKFKLNNDFTLQKTSDYTIVLNWMQPLHTIRELPVEMVVDGAYVADTLPAGTTLTPVMTDGSSYMTFKLEDGSTGRILFTRGENVEVYIDGVIESEYFDNIAYSDQTH